MSEFAWTENAFLDATALGAAARGLNLLAPRRARSAEAETVVVVVRATAFILVDGGVKCAGSDEDADRIIVHKG